MSPEILQMLYFLGFAVAGWFLKKFFPDAPTLPMPKSPGLPGTPTQQQTIIGAMVDEIELRRVAAQREVVAQNLAEMVMIKKP